MFQQFTQDGFAALREEWQQYHIHQDQAVELQMADGQTVNGIARGVTLNGELCVETTQGMRHFNSGEVGAQR